MTTSFTFSESHTFTVTHARRLAAKVATDLKRMQRFYGRPKDAEVQAYEVEIVELLKGGYLHIVTYGFKRNGNWVEPTLRYTARDLAGLTGTNDDPGRVLPGANVVGAHFGSYLMYSNAWSSLAPAEREALEKRLPVKRVTCTEPGIDGYMVPDRTYSNGGRALDRASLRSLPR